jgi:hypothetical protein
MLLRFFSSYVISSPKWTYRPGDFAQLPLPLKDQVQISLRLVNGTTVTNLTVRKFVLFAIAISADVSQ